MVDTRKLAQEVAKPLEVKLTGSKQTSRKMPSIAK
jgi:hypothetical protein